MRISRISGPPRPAATVDRWCAEFERRCRATGLRVTPQRLAVYRALAEDASHPTADGVYAAVRRRLPGFSRATVYRVLDSLEREHLIRRVSTPQGVARFDANVDHHQHLVCRVCGTMIDVSVPALADATPPTIDVPGFVVERLDVRLVGRCGGCRRGGKRGAGRASGRTR
ncbi:MAG TPA: transcriptional repressor [Candidatus Tectomicrobia bacterium]|nr:transcriptional repressor [Candidatus Tectomicrobia bacterium]